MYRILFCHNNPNPKTIRDFLQLDPDCPFECTERETLEDAKNLANLLIKNEDVKVVTVYFGVRKEYSVQHG